MNLTYHRAKQMAELIVDHITKEPTSHREWVDKINRVHEIARLLVSNYAGEVPAHDLPYR